MQLSREELLKAYQGMCLIREIEKECGHMAHIEKPSVVNDAINSIIVG